MSATPIEPAAPAVPIEFYPHERDRTWTTTPPSPEARAFHRALPGYQPTPLVDLPELARELGVGRVVAKDESSRLGLPAFKALGATWAVHRALQLDSLTTAIAGITVVTATDGNHGRAVARSARLLGHPALIFMPAGGVHPLAVQAIVDEGARVVEVAGNYDAAVDTAARAAAAPGHVLVQDTAWEGYEQIPGWIVEGYATLFGEVDDQLGDATADLVLVPTGVGSLLQAALAHYRSATARLGSAVVSVEPTTAACMAPSLAAGQPVTVDTGATIMSGLNCGTPSSLAWPLVHAGLDAAVAVPDSDTERAIADLHQAGVLAGPCGAASLAGARRVLLGRDTASQRAHLGLGPDATVVLVITEGAHANPAASTGPATS